MLKLLALLSPRIQAILDLPTEIEQAVIAVRTVLNKYDSDPEVQHAINEIGDVQEKMREIKR
jgi:hypothetical protein